MTGLLFLVLAAFAAEDSGDFDAFFADFAKKRDGVYVLEARFEQENVTPEETIKSVGSIVYVRPKRIVFRYEEPEGGVTYLIDGAKAYEYEQDIRQLQIYNLEDNPETEVFFLGFDDNTDALKKAYHVEGFEPEDEALGSHGILLRPKAIEGEEVSFQEVRLFLRDKDYLPQRIHVVNDDTAHVTIRILDLKVNGPIDPTKTQITLSEGTKIVDNDEFVEKVGPGGKLVPEPMTPLNQVARPPANKDTPAP